MVVVDVLNDAGGRELLFEKYGLRKVPVLAKGDQYAFGPDARPVREARGLPMPGRRPALAGAALPRSTR